jgi:hypothetical protein
MNDSMLMLVATSRRADLMREAGQARLAARRRRSRPTPRATAATDCEKMAGTVNRAATENGSAGQHGAATANDTAIREKAGSRR